MTRTQFPECKRRFQTHGTERLKDFPPHHKSHTQTTQPETQEKIVALSVGAPRLRLTIIYDRLLRLEERNADNTIALTVEQIAPIEEASPCFRERHLESSEPGDPVTQDAFFVRKLASMGKVYIQAVVVSMPSAAVPSTSYALGSLLSARWR